MPYICSMFPTCADGIHPPVIPALLGSRAFTVLHSLQHSFASIGVHVQSGRFAGHVSALLGHGFQSKAITERYITADPEGLRPAADAIAAEIAAHLGLGEPAKVLEFAKGGRKE